MAISEQQLQTDLVTAGIIRAASLMSLMTMLVICHIYAEKIQIDLDEQLRITIRTILYVVTILTFPILKFVRHVMLRLQKNNTPPKSRYLLAITVTMLIAESMGIFGFVMYVLGDSYNTLYIFTMLSALAMFLHKPNKEEYKEIFES